MANPNVNSHQDKDKTKCHVFNRQKSVLKALKENVNQNSVLSSKMKTEKYTTVVP